MHRIGCEDDHLRATTFKGLCLIVENISGGGPFAFHLQRLDFGEIKRANKQFRGMKTPKSRARQFAEFTVISLCRCSRHTAKYSYCPHTVRSSAQSPYVAPRTAKIHTLITLGIRHRAKALVLKLRRRRPRGFDYHRPLHSEFRSAYHSEARAVTFYYLGVSSNSN